MKLSYSLVCTIVFTATVSISSLSDVACKCTVNQSYSLEMNRQEIRLYENNAEREQMDNLGELFAVLNALEHLEKMFARFVKCFVLNLLKKLFTGITFHMMPTKLNASSCSINTRLNEVLMEEEVFLCDDKCVQLRSQCE